MHLQTKTVRQGINKAYLKVIIKRADLDHFKEEATAYLKSLSHADGESEEHLKGYLRDFLQNSFYNKEERLVNTSNRVDLGIYSGKTKSSTLEVVIEAKKPGNTREMITKNDANAKALQEALLYYFEEREGGNEDIKQVVITNYTEFFFFDAQEIERNFYSKKSLVKTFRNWKIDQKVSSNTDFMYGKFGEFISSSDANLNGIHLNLKDFKSKLATPATGEEDKDLIPLYKLFSPEHLVKKPFANDSNSLDKRFYNELLHILGLQEVKEKGSRLIQRLPKKKRQRGSLIENTIEILRYDQHMNEVREATVHYGDQEDDQLFGVALELVITWMNRVLFLKLMEAQLLAYHQKDEKFKFLHFDLIDEYDELNKLFFRVLALRNEDRPLSVQERFGHIPYLNSSLFDSTKLEKTTIQISGLDDKAALSLHSRSVLKKGNNPPEGPLNTLDYLLRFLDAYNFSAESSGGIQTEDKTLINASVLGLIFEKINGYKDGSFFTPGFITEYMARETLRKAVVDKFAATLTPGPSPEPPSPSVPLPPAGEGSGNQIKEPGWKLPESLVENARHLRKNQTDAEKLLWELLRNRQFFDFKFRRQHPVKPGFVLDFYCAEQKLTVELDGGIHDEEEQKLSDEERTQILNERGIEVIRFRNEDVLNNTNRVLKELAEKLGVYPALTPIPSPAGGRGVPEGRGEGGLGEGDLTLTDIYNRIGREISIQQANEIINSITICDPAVGSGHFLVSCLNELIAIKSELKILCDHEGKRIPYLDIEVENDELAIEHEGELFEYKLNHEWKNGQVIRKPAGKERQRIQESLFHEKKFLIENCLFGVDINPNSVKICRLRLWIELLKHAYYRSHTSPHPNPLPEGEGMNKKDLPSPAGGRGAGDEGESYSELEVLPNIDINIKQGNSLVSRFGLDEDLSSIFKKSEHSLEDYKGYVKSYRETRDRSEKQRLQNLIDDIKAEYSESLLNNKPINKKLSKARGKLDLMQNEDLFGEGKATKKDLEKQEKKVAKLEEQKAEEEAGAFYREAFEWRFEFPEVLDEEGRYKGFDVVIGNPPYVSIQDLKKEDVSTAEYYKSQYKSTVGNFDIYIPFIELSNYISNSDFYSSFILPSKFLNTNYGEAIRDIMIKESLVDSIVDFEHHQVFDTATTYTCILNLSGKRKKGVKFVQCKPHDILSAKENLGFISYKKLSEGYWNLIDENLAELIDKCIKQGVALKNIPCLISRGSSTGNDKVFVLEESENSVVNGYGEEVDIERDILVRPIFATNYSRYSFEKEGLRYLIFPYNYENGNYDSFDENYISENFPKTFKYLMEKKSLLEERKQYSDWFLYSAPRNLKVHGESNILIPLLADRGLFALTPKDDEYTLMAGGGFSISIKNSSLNPKYLLGLINSKLIFEILYTWSNKFRGGFITCTKQYVENLPVIIPTKSKQNEIAKIADQILTAKKENPEADNSELEAEIDRLVYELYGLNEEEIGVVEDSFT